jgi:dimethylhistidine N-methyltransferase
MADATKSQARFVLRRGADEEPRFGEDVRAGLTAVRKAIPPRYFYDDLGSALFDAITNLPEYYLTRAESEILNGYRREIATALGPVARVIELGSGSGRKTRLLLDEIVRGSAEIEYVPVDLDVSLLQRLGGELLGEYPSLSVTAVAADLRRPARIIRDHVRPMPGRTSVLFLGSTIGNLDAEESVLMLRDLKTLLRAGDTILLGVDLKKPKSILDAAYNDALGVTAAFNLNVLQRINRELGGRFDLRAFAHRAFFDEKLSRIEMHLVSLREQSVLIERLRLEAAFVEGETIHTENSYKYGDSDVEALARQAGFEVSRKWTDANGWFADILLVAR